MAPFPDVVARIDGVAGEELRSRFTIGLHVTICVASATVKEMSLLPDNCVAVDAAVARTEHVPTAVKVMTAVDGLIVHPVVPALTNE